MAETPQCFADALATMTLGDTSQTCGCCYAVFSGILDVDFEIQTILWRIRVCMYGATPVIVPCLGLAAALLLEHTSANLKTLPAVLADHVLHGTLESCCDRKR